MSAERLYTPELLAAAVELAAFPLIQGAASRGHARSVSCGSTLDLDLVLDSAGRIDRIGLQVRACAVGQGAASIFARHAPGRSADEIRIAHDRLSAWLEEEAPAPDWPDLDLIAPARAYRGRHGAMLLPWKAALDALSSAPASS